MFVTEFFWKIRYALFFLWRYLISLVKQWTFLLFLGLDIVGLAYVLSGIDLEIPQDWYIVAALTVFIVANVDAIRKKEFITLTKPHRELLGHTFKPNSLAFSLDGKYLVSASDRIAIIWRTKDGQKVQRLQCDTWIGQALFTQNGRHVIGIGGKGNFFRWSVQTGEQLFLQKLHESDSVALALSPVDNKWMATADKNGKIFLWRYPAVEHVKTFVMGDVEIRKVAFASDGSWVVACDVSGKVAIFDFATGSETLIFQHATNEPIRYVTVAPNGNLLAFVDGSGSIYVYSLERKLLLPPQQGHDDMALCCAFNADGSILASGGQDNKIVIWKVRKSGLARLFMIAAHSEPVISLLFEKKRNNLYSSSRDRKIRYWKLDYLLFSEIILGR